MMELKATIFCLLLLAIGITLYKVLYALPKEIKRKQEDEEALKAKKVKRSTTQTSTRFSFTTERLPPFPKAGKNIPRKVQHKG